MMLSVSLNLTAIAAMILGTAVPDINIEADSLNSPTVKPIPGDGNMMGVPELLFKSDWESSKNIYPL